MKKFVKVSLLGLVGVAMVVPTMTTPADAAGKVKVLSTKKVAKQAYHGTKGNLYSSAKLTHRKYQLKKYQYTTWYSYKKSVIKQNGKKRTYYYVKAGKKAGWIYSKSLQAGKAPAANRVLSQSAISAQAYHGTKGNLYNTPTLSKRVYQLKNYKHTTWTATQQATVSLKGKQRTYLYVSAGNKHGWIYNKSLKAGQAPVNKAARLKAAYVAYNKAIMVASSYIQSCFNAASMSYSDMGNSINTAGNYESGTETPSELKADIKAYVNVYNVFRNRFSANEQKNMDAMSTKLQNMSISESSTDYVASSIESFANSLSNLVGDLK